MEILKIKLNEKQPIAQQLYLTEESDYGLAIQIDGLQSQGPESITFNGSQLTSEKDKVADYNLFKIKTPKYDKTQNKYLIEIPDIDGSVTYKITVNIIQSETVYQDNGNGNSELPAWTENIEGTADTLCIRKDNTYVYSDSFCVYTPRAGLFVGQDAQLSSGGGNIVKVSIVDDDGVTISQSGTERFNINNSTSQIYSPDKRSIIRLTNNEANINLNCKTVLSSDNNKTSLLYDNGNTGIFLGQNSLSINYCGTTGIEMSQNLHKITNGCSEIVLYKDSIDINVPLEAKIGVNNNTVLSAGSFATVLFKDGVYTKMGGNDMELYAPCNISLSSDTIQLSSRNIETAGCYLLIKNNNIIAYNNCTEVTNAQLSYLFQIAQKLTPENLPSVLEILGLNT